MSIGKYLAQLRGEKNMSRRELGERIEQITGIKTTDETLWRAETGRTKLEGPTLVAIMDILGAQIPHITLLLRTPNAPDALISLLVTEATATQQMSDAESAEFATLVSLYRTIRPNEKLFQRWLGYTQRLIEEIHE